MTDDMIARERIEALSKRLDEREEANGRALIIQSAELARRLHVLNGEAERLQNAVAANVSSDTWAGFLKRYEDGHTDLEKRLLRIEGFQARLLGAYGLMMLLMPLIFIVISHLLK